MNDKKNIERFFQEKFKDFESNPDAMAWDKISERINKKKNKRRAFPFWFKTIGLAASLIIGYFVFNNFNKDIEIIKDENAFVTSDKVAQDNNETNLNESKNDSIVVINAKINKFELNENSVKNNVVDVVAANKEKVTANEVIVNTSNTKKQVKSIILSSGKNPNTNNAIAAIDRKKDEFISSNNSSDDALSNNKNKNNQRDVLIANVNKKQAGQNNKLENKKEAYNKVNELDEFENKNNSTVNNAFASKNENKNNNIVQKNAVAANIQIQENEMFEIANKNLAQEKTDQNLLAKADKQENALDKILKEKTDKSKKATIASISEKWTIRPNVAPIFMKAFTGSPIHDIFKDNEKDFENQVSIGLAADYAVTKKISIRAGINKFDLAYNTNDVAFYADPALTSGSLNTINFRPETQNLVVNDRKSRGTAPGNIPIIAENGVMNQSFGYLEFPVEVSYKLFDSKIGVTVITGLSTLLLNKNEVTLTSDSRKFVLGDANNLNNVHFSTNIGIGFKYKFWKSFEANVEPTLKYQIDTFSYDSGGFNPYFLGIYSGISYRL